MTTSVATVGAVPGREPVAVPPAARVGVAAVAPAAASGRPPSWVRRRGSCRSEPHASGRSGLRVSGLRVSGVGATRVAFGPAGFRVG
ncbi:hypothetical protein [Actinomycetospora sp.]|uniref:hypothetical protein n=1 Tax=Actinomycetospora sp. TaxID=1872135 RepID=UPI002F42D935